MELDQTLKEGKIFTRLQQHVRRHNQAQTELRHTIRLGPLLTLQALTNEYIKRVRQAMRLNEFPDDDRLPSYWASRRRLSNLIKCCDRTIYNHLDLLSAAGLIVKRWHGSLCDFELWLNPWFLYPEVNESPLVVDLTTNCPLPFPLAKGQTLPHKSIVKTEKSNNLSKGGVETVDNRLPSRLNDLVPPSQRVVLNTENTENTEKRRCAAPKKEEGWGGGPAAPGVDNSVDSAKKDIPLGQRLLSRFQRSDKAVQRSTGTTETLRNSQPVVAPFPSPDPVQEQRREHYKSLVTSFWDIVQPDFWPVDYSNPDKLGFSDNHKRDILRLIWTDVFGSFSDQPTEKIATERYMVRLQQVQKALANARRHRWTSFLPPKSYFSLAFYEHQKKMGQKGSFWFTWDWMVADAKQRQRVENDHLLQRAIYSIINEKAPRGLKDGRDMSRVQLASYWRNRIYKLGDADILDQFNLAVLAPMPGRPTTTQFPVEKKNRRSPKLQPNDK